MVHKFSPIRVRILLSLSILHSHVDAPDEELTLRPVGGEMDWDGNVTIAAGKVLVDCQGSKVKVNASGLHIGRLQ